MSVRHNAVITCNQCGKEEILPLGDSLYPGWASAPGWLQVTPVPSGINFSIGTDTPGQARNRIPDLCSWDCMMLYASQKATTLKESRERSS